MHYSTGPGNFFKAATGVEKRHASGKNGKKSRHKLSHFWPSRVTSQFASV